MFSRVLPTPTGQISPDQSLLAFTRDTLGEELFSLTLRHIASGRSASLVGSQRGPAETKQRRTHQRQGAGGKRREVSPSCAWREPAEGLSGGQVERGQEMRGERVTTGVKSWRGCGG